jgi:hypothetical protein
MNGCSTNSETSYDGTSPTAFGTGRNPRASAQITSAVPKAVSNSVSGMKVAISVDQREPGMWRWTIASLTASPPRAGMTAFRPEPAR